MICDLNKTETASTIQLSMRTELATSELWGYWLTLICQGDIFLQKYKIGIFYVLQKTGQNDHTYSATYLSY